MLVGSTRFDGLARARRPSSARLVAGARPRRRARVRAASSSPPASPRDRMPGHAPKPLPRALPEVTSPTHTASRRSTSRPRGRSRATSSRISASRPTPCGAAIRSRGRRRLGRVARVAVAADPRGIRRRDRRPRVRRRADGAQPLPGARSGTADGGRPARGTVARRATANRCERRDSKAGAYRDRLARRAVRIVRSEAAGRGRPVARERHARRNHARGRRAARSACDFRQGAFRFGMSSDTTAMMGGGRLLARLRRRRLARPVRRQLVRPSGHDRVGSTRRTAAERALPQRPAGRSRT